MKTYYVQFIKDGNKSLPYKTIAGNIIDAVTVAVLEAIQQENKGYSINDVVHVSTKY